MQHEIRRGGPEPMELVMDNVIDQSQKVWAAYARLCHDRLAGLGEATDGLTKLEESTVERAEQALDQLSRFGKESFAQLARAGLAWHKAWLGAFKDGLEALERPSPLDRR